jgi:UDP-glucose 4-epimerase
MAKILVTGGAGFIGSHVTDHLIEQGNEVVVLDDLSGGFKENVNPKAEFIKGSILDVSLVESLFEEHRFEYVFHLAAYAAEGLSHFIKRFNYNNNLIGSVNLINASVLNKVKCFVFTSSIAVYGKNQLPMQEDMVPLPEDPYGIAKFAVEKELEATRMMFGLDYVIFRPHNVYGERQNIGDKYRNVLGIFISQILRGESMTIFGDGAQSRAFTYIDDVAPLIAQAIEKPEVYNEIFNIGSDKPYTVRVLAELVAEIMKVKPEIQCLAPRNEVQHAFSDHSKLNTYFGQKKAVDIEEGVAQMIRWVKSVGLRKSNDFDDIEIPFNLPENW